MAKPFKSRTSTSSMRNPNTAHESTPVVDRRIRNMDGTVDVLMTLQDQGIGQVPSMYQLAVYDAIANGTSNISVDALAGSGKTTTMVNGLRITDPYSRILFCCFNKTIADELKAKCEAAGLTHVKASTTHSACYGPAMGYAKSKFKGAVVDAKKDIVIAERVITRAGHSIKATRYGQDVLQANPDILEDVRTAGSLAMATLTDMGDVSALMRICAEYGKDLNMPETSLPLVSLWASEMAGDCSMVSFDEMLYWVAIGRAVPNRYDMVIVDEAQDLNACQMAALLRMVDLGNNGRMIIVGDVFQSIYGFRGADPRAIPRMVERMTEVSGKPTLRLPLSICYRCDHAILEMARTLVPAIEDRPGAGEGKVVAHKPESYGNTMGSLKAGDMVICRVNAPLVGGALSCIARGVPAYVQGRDIGYSVRLFIRNALNVKKGQTLTDPVSVAEFNAKVTMYAAAEAEKAKAAGYDNKAAGMQDKADTAIALAQGFTDPFMLKELEDRIDNIFRDDAGGVKFSSVHRAKGAEADRVVILAPELMPHPMAKTEAAKEQEKNLHYVAITRAKRVLEMQPLIKKAG